MVDRIKKLNYFLTINRKDILEGPDKISHEYTMSHIEKEYDTFKNRINNLPSDVELHYLESIGDLKKISDKNN